MEILTTKEASRFLKVSDRTLRRWIEDGLPHIQVKKGGKLLFFKKKLYEWLEENSEPMPIHLKIHRLKLLRRR